MGLAQGDFVERGLAADGFIVVGDFFEALRRYWDAFGHAGKKRANLFATSWPAKGDQKHRVVERSHRRTTLTLPSPAIGRGFKINSRKMRLLTARSAHARRRPG